MSIARQVLILDNGDSAAYGLSQYIQELGIACEVIRTREVTVDLLSERTPAAVVIGPGPGRPESAFECRELLSACYSQHIPSLGVGLGMHVQIGLAGGASQVLSRPKLGQTAEVNHVEAGIFDELPNPLRVCLYQHLTCSLDTLPSALGPTATLGSEVMAIENERHRAVGVEFHPHSIMTQNGYRLIANWLLTCGLEASFNVAAESDNDNEKLHRQLVWQDRMARDN